MSHKPSALAPHQEPQRIVSLVPSDSYTLAQLGAAERIVGRTEYCIEPAALLDVPSVGGTKNADVKAIVALKPDLVVVNQEENRQVDIERLQRAGVPLLLSFPKTVEEGLQHVERLLDAMPSLAAQNRQRVAQARRRCEQLSQRQALPVDVFVPIWMDPLMTVNGATFISDVVELVGGRNVFSDRVRRYPLAADLGHRAPLPAAQVAHRDNRYPRVTLDELTSRQPQLVLLPDEPHEFTSADAAVFAKLAIPAAPAHIKFCDGKDLMWYGLRSLEGLDRLVALLDSVRDEAQANGSAS